MKVFELKALLDDCMDEDAQVVILSHGAHMHPYYRINRDSCIEDVAGRVFVVLDEGSQIGYSLEDFKR